MESIDTVVGETAAPAGANRELFDARDLPPPQPLQGTLERLETMDPDTVLVQLNDRAPQFLYPKLKDRGYAYETQETEGATVTVVWSD